MIELELLQLFALSIKAKKFPGSLQVEQFVFDVVHNWQETSQGS